MMRTLMVLVMACGSTTTAPPPHTQATRVITPRTKLPAAIVPLVPQHGIYAAGGGLMSAPWRVVVDTDANTIFAGSSQSANSPSFGKLEHENTKPLTPPNKQHLMQLANDAWTEAPDRPRDPTADYDEIVVVADGDDTFFLQGYGPIHRPLAMKLIEEVRAAGAL
jgi:hypothetical protein